MTTTDFLPPPSDPQPASPSPGARVIRRSTDDRVAAGVAGGLGEYFGYDPVLFRVLFATTAFFAGAGVLAYLIAWAVIPEAGANGAPLDRVALELRRRHVPIWLVLTVAGIIAWSLLFSWWAPWPFVPVLLAVVVLIAAFSRRAPRPVPVFDEPVAVAASAESSGWAAQTRAWIDEGRERARVRRRRAAPVRWATLGTLVLTLAVLALADRIGGIVLPAYFWTAGAIVLAGLVTGAILRRMPWSLTPLLVPIAIGLVAFAGSGASLHDGVGQRVWTPATAEDLDGSYRLAFGQGTLDLGGLTPLASTRHVTVTMASGQVRVYVPRDVDATVYAHVRFGQVTVDGSSNDRDSGTSVTRVVTPAAGASGAALMIDVQLDEGNIEVDRR